MPAKLRKIELASKMQIRLLEKLKSADRSNPQYEEILNAVMNLAVYISELAAAPVREKHTRPIIQLTKEPPSPTENAHSEYDCTDVTELNSPAQDVRQQRERSFEALLDKLLSPTSKEREYADILNQTVNIYEPGCKPTLSEDDALDQNRSDDALYEALMPIEAWQYDIVQKHSDRRYGHQEESPNASFFEFCEDSARLGHEELSFSPIKQLPINLPPRSPEDRGLSIDSPVDKNLCLRRLKSKATMRIGFFPNKLDLKKSLDLAIKTGNEKASGNSIGK
jgi:hypothetical protein